MQYLRLKKKKDFLKVLKAGKRVHCRSLTVVYFPSNTIKMAVCVGKKYGKSVKRNRIKRLLREAFRTIRGSVFPACSFLLIPKEAEEYSYAAFQRDLAHILKKEKLLEDRSDAPCGGQSQIPEKNGI